MIAAYHTHWADLIRYYSDLAGMESDGFAVTEPAYLAASAVMDQNPTVTQFAMYTDTGSGSTSPLMFLWDTAVNLPVVPNGGNITIQWAGSPNYIATLFEDMCPQDQELVRRLGKRRLLDLLRDGVGIVVDLANSGGLWFPVPQVFQE